MHLFQLYGDAEKAIEQVLKLDQHCKEASSKLFTCRILQLMVSPGFRCYYYFITHFIVELSN